MSFADLDKNRGGRAGPPRQGGNMYNGQIGGFVSQGGNAGGFGSQGGGFGSQGSSYNDGLRSQPRGDDYKRLNERATGNIFQISNNVASLQKMVSYLGSQRDTHEMRDRMHQVQDSTRRLARETGDLLKSLGSQPAVAPQEASKRKLQQQKLGKDFGDVLHKFENIQKLSMQKERETVARAKRSISHYEDESRDLSEKDHLLQRQEQDRMIQLENDVEYNEALIMDREQGIKDIENTILEVNEIFRDLGALVQDQGHMLENIESNITSVSTHVETGTHELGEAQTHQKKARNKMCCLLFIVLIVLAVIILVLVLKL